MLVDKDDYKMALAKSYRDPESYQHVVDLIDKYFNMIHHLTTTSLYDVLKYEDSITKAIVGPMEILAYENETLKKEVNKLRRELGKIEKYKEETE